MPSRVNRTETITSDADILYTKFGHRAETTVLLVALSHFIYMNKIFYALNLQFCLIIENCELSLFYLKFFKILSLCELTICFCMLAN
jgi:hypothetical protein